MHYEDTMVSVDGNGITIKRYGFFGSPRTIRFEEVAEVTETRLGDIGRWRLVGAGPGGGMRNWYGWDGSRRSKDTAFSFDVDRFWHPTVTPEDADGFRIALPTGLGGNR